MDESRRWSSHQDIRERIGPASVVVEAVDESVIHAEQLPAEPPPRENAQIAFFGDEQQVREGFAIALRAMGLDENLLAAGIPAPATHTNRKDN